VVYATQGQTFSLSLESFHCDSIEARWFDPRLGVYMGPRRFPCEGIMEFDPPGKKEPGNDWVLVLEGVD
jgi:hypothetical protein